MSDEQKEVNMDEGHVDHPGAAHASRPIPPNANHPSHPGGAHPVSANPQGLPGLAQNGNTPAKVDGHAVIPPKHPVAPPKGTNPGTSVTKQ